MFGVILGFAMMVIASLCRSSNGLLSILFPAFTKYSLRLMKVLSVFSYFICHADSNLEEEINRQITTQDH